MKHPAVSDDETLLDSPQAREFFGNRSAMWLYRRERESETPEPGKPVFPTPVVIANRKYWPLGELRRYRDACRTTARLPSPRQRPSSRKK